MRRFIFALTLPLVLLAALADARLPFGGITAPVSDPIATLSATWSHNTWHSACPQEKNHCSFGSLISSSYYSIANFDAAVADPSTGYCNASPCRASGSGTWATDAAVAVSGDQSTGVNPGANQQWGYTAAAKSSDGKFSCMTGGGHSIGADGSIYCINLAAAAQNILNSGGTSGGTWMRSLASGRLIDACAVPAYSGSCGSTYPFTETVPAWEHIAALAPSREKAAYIEVESPGPLQQRMGNFFVHSYYMSAFLPNHVFVPGGTNTEDIVSGGVCCVGGVFPYHVDTGLMDAAAPIFVPAGVDTYSYLGTANGLSQGRAGDGVGYPIAVCPNGDAVAVDNPSGSGGNIVVLFYLTHTGAATFNVKYSVQSNAYFNVPADADALCLPDPVAGAGHYGFFYQSDATHFMYFSDVAAAPQAPCTSSTNCWQQQAFSGTVPAACSTWTYSGLSGYANVTFSYDSLRNKIAINQGDGHICEIGVSGGTLGSNPALWSVTELTSNPTGDIPGDYDACNSPTLPRMAYDAAHDLFVVDICGGEWWYKP